MGRRSSDSEDDSRRRKRKQRRRSSSSSSSSSSRSRSKVTSRSSRRSARRSRSRDRDRDRDRNRDRRHRRRSSSSSSHSSSRRRRSRSADRDKGRSHRSHRSRSRERRSHSRHRRSRSSSHSRRRSRSHSRDRSRRRDREKQRDRDKDRSKDKTDKKGDPGSLKSKGLEHLAPSEQAKVRMQLVLQAAAKTDEALKAKVAKREEDARKKLAEEGTSLEEQVRRIKDIEAIESDSFVPQAFKSSRDQLKVEEKLEVEITSSQNLSLPTSTVYNDTDTLAHPNLFMDKDKAEELWIKRLISLRQERLLGSPVT